MKYVIVLLLWLFCLVNISSGQTSISVALPSFSVTRGDTVKVSVTVGDLTGKGVFDFSGKIRFREDVLDFIAVSSESCLTEQAQWTNPTANFDKDSQAIFACYGANALAGSGKLINLFFHVTGNYGDSTALKFESFTFTRDSQLTPNFTNGKLYINLQPVRVIITTNQGTNLQVFVDGVAQMVPFSASWYPGTPHTIGIDATQNGGEGARYYFAGWSDGGNQTHSVSPTEDVTFMANLNAEYFLRVVSDYAAPASEGWYMENSVVPMAVDTIVQLTETSKMIFQSWAGSGTGAYSGTESSFNLTITGPVTETVVWQKQFWLEVKTLPENVTTLSGSGWYDENQSVETGTAPSQLTNRTFKGWLVDGQPESGNPITILMDASHVAVADYSDNISVTIATSTGRGIVIVDGQNIDAPALLTWSAGSTHTIGVPDTQNEQAGARYRFVAWSDGEAQTHTVSPQQNLTITAILGVQYYLSISTVPGFLEVIEGAGWYDANTTAITGTAPETQNVSGTYYSFVNWVADGERMLVNPLSIIMDRPKIAVATYYMNYFITGQIKSSGLPVANVKVRLGGGLEDSVFTNSNGEFKFEGLYPQSYSIQPVSADFRFTPEIYNYPILFANRKLQDFTAEDVAAPAVRLTYPNGGERLQAGGIDTIRWQATDNVGIDSIRLHYSRDGGANWHFMFQRSGEQNSVGWVIFEKNSTEYKIKIEALDYAKNSSEDLSDANFEIYGGVGVIPAVSGKIEAFHLSQNFPNPFNPVTEFIYQLPRRSSVFINIYNLAGQQVREVFTGIQPGGSYSIRWDGADNSGAPMPSGIYYCQMQTGECVKTRKMVLMR